jgi:hypothetical protein
MFKKKLSEWSMLPADVEVTHFYGMDLKILRNIYSLAYGLLLSVKIAGSGAGSNSNMHGSTDLDSYQNVTDP